MGETVATHDRAEKAACVMTLGGGDAKSQRTFCNFENEVLETRDLVHTVDLVI